MRAVPAPPALLRNGSSSCTMDHPSDMYADKDWPSVQNIAMCYIRYCHGGKAATPSVLKRIQSTQHNAEWLV